jgi:Tfp pilus assembly protein FimT
MTLLEVLVTLVVLALLTAVATLAPRQDTHRANDLRAMLADSLAAAIAQGRRITIVTRVGDAERSATLSPDGRVVADSALLALARADSTHAR